MSIHPTSKFTEREPLLTYEAAGKLLGVTARTIWTLVDEGQLPRVRFGHSVRIDPRDLREFIERSKATQFGQGQQNRGGQ